jgi:hypothetical protein
MSGRKGVVKNPKKPNRKEKVQSEWQRVRRGRRKKKIMTNTRNESESKMGEKT